MRTVQKLHLKRIKFEKCEKFSTLPGIVELFDFFSDFDC